MRIRVHAEARKNMTDDEYKYLLLLEFHEEFNNAVKRIRDDLNIPTKKGLPDQKQIYEKSLALTLELNIPITFWGSIESIIEWGQVLMATHSIQVFGIEAQLNRKFLYNRQLRPPPPKTFPKGRRQYETAIRESWYRSNRNIISQSSIEPAYPLIQINKRLTIPQLLKAIKAKEEKQYQFLRSISSNLFLKDKEVIVTHKTPFSYLLNLGTHPNGLARWDDFRTADWSEIVEYPELVIQQSQQLLAL